MLNRLLTLVIGLGVAFLVMTQVVPFLRDQFVPRPVSIGTTADSADTQCVDLAAQAHDRLFDAARSYGQPPVDVDEWSQAVWEIELEVQAAQSACLCGSPACEAASQALQEMTSLLANLDGMVKGDSPGFANPGHQQDQILRFLDQARSAIEY